MCEQLEKKKGGPTYGESKNRYNKAQEMWTETKSCCQAKDFELYHELHNMLEGFE